MAPILQTIRVLCTLFALATISSVSATDGPSPYDAGVAPDVVTSLAFTSDYPYSEGPLLEFPTDSNGTDNESFQDNSLWGIDKRAAEFCKHLRWQVQVI
jgi:hypothetical protein